MRIISGRLKGKKLKSIKGDATRPTSDRVREALFNILDAETLHNAFVLDLFAGTGALGIEALSRGAKAAVFVEKAKPAMAVLRSNVEACGLTAVSRLIRWDIEKNLNCLRSFENELTLVFMDPPYNRGMVEPALIHLIRSRAMATGTTVVVEHDPAEKIEKIDQFLKAADHRRYGQTILSFFTFMGGKDCIDINSMLE